MMTQCRFMGLPLGDGDDIEEPGRALHVDLYFILSSNPQERLPQRSIDIQGDDLFLSESIGVAASSWKDEVFRDESGVGILSLDDREAHASCDLGRRVIPDGPQKIQATTQLGDLDLVGTTQVLRLFLEGVIARGHGSLVILGLLVRIGLPVLRIREAGLQFPDDEVQDVEFDFHACSVFQ